MRPLIIGLALTFTSNAQLTWSLASGNESWPADKRAAIVSAMTEAVDLYNANGYFPKTLWANYNASVPTAQASYSGWIDFGGSIGTRVALHEISHTLGVGTVSAWNNNRSGNTWTGTFATNRVKLFNGASATLSADNAHFWPYGLNYDSEDGTTNRVRHIKMVSALRRDMNIVKDSDGDGLPDDWEMFHFGNLTQTATGDADGDGVNNLAEYNADSNPAAFTTQWNGTTSSDWGVASNWAPGMLASNGTFFARLNVNNASNHPLIYDAARGTTILRPADRGLVIGSGTSGGGAMTLTGGSFSTVGAASPDIIGNSGNTASLTIDGGAFASDELHLGVSSSGTGTLTLQSGSATIGTLAFRFSTGSGTVNLNGGILTTGRINRSFAGSATLHLDSATIRASADEPAFLEGLTNAFIKSGGVTIDTSTRTITIAQVLRTDPSSPNGGITKSGSGILTLTAANTYTGPTNIQAGILIPQNSAALGSSVSIAADATLGLTGSQSYHKTQHLTISSTGQKSATIPTPAVQRGALQSIAGNNIWNGNLTIATTNTRIGVQDGASLTLNGTISDSAPATSVIFRAGLNPGDDITLNTPATWTGDTIAYSSSATGGALRLGAPNVLPATSVLLLAGNNVAGRLDLNGFDQTLAGLSNATGGQSPIGAGIITNTGSAPATLTLAPTTGRTYIGTIQDGTQPIHLIKAGPATQILTAAQAYTGNTIITAGTLRLDQPFLSDSSHIAISSGAKLHLNFTGTDTIATLTLGGTAMPPGTYNSTTHASYFLGTGSLSVPTHFTNWLNLFPDLTDADRSPAADPDRDKLTNLAEYALGTAPDVFQADAITLERAPGSQVPGLTFHRLPARTDVTITIEAGATLGDWRPIARSTAGNPFTPLLDGVQCSETTVDANRMKVTITDAPPAPPASRFLRLAITRQ
jgi:autotransporter-associated beta strand protein